MCCADRVTLRLLKVTFVSLHRNTATLFHTFHSLGFQPICSDVKHRATGTEPVRKLSIADNPSCIANYSCADSS